jgi:hypothetical protein
LPSNVGIEQKRLTEKKHQLTTLGGFDCGHYFSKNYTKKVLWRQTNKIKIANFWLKQSKFEKNFAWFSNLT